MEVIHGLLLRAVHQKETPRVLKKRRPDGASLRNTLFPLFQVQDLEFEDSGGDFYLDFVAYLFIDDGTADGAFV